jgi:LVIVD repeat-containing protein
VKTPRTEFSFWPTWSHGVRCAVISIDAAVLLLMGLTRNVTADSDGVDFTLVDLVGGAIDAATIDGTTAFVGVGKVVEVFDLSNPAAPTLTGASQWFDGGVTDLAVSGDLVMVAHHTGLAMLDVSDLTQPRQIGRVDMPEETYGVAAEGTWFTSRIYPKHPRNRLGPHL